jgi:hypothetical protein
LAKAIDNADDIVVDFLAGQTADSREWPGDEKLIQAMLELPLYRLLTRGRMRMILESVEEKMRTPKSEEPQVYRGTLTIEHVLPQEWKANWPLEQLETPENPEEYRVPSADRHARATEAHDWQSYTDNWEAESGPFKWAVGRQAGWIAGA